MALTEKEKMLSGEPYIAGDEELVRERLEVRHLLHEYNHLPAIKYHKGISHDEFFNNADMVRLKQEIFGISEDAARKLSIEKPLFLDYGKNTEFKGSFYANFNTTILDCAKVTIGDAVLFGPNVNIYAASHSVDVDERMQDFERAYPVSIGDRTWVGGNVTFVGPAKVGKNCTVAAHALVRGEFPDNVVIGGVPARILKHLGPPKTVP